MNRVERDAQGRTTAFRSSRYIGRSIVDRAGMIAYDESGAPSVIELDNSSARTPYAVMDKVLWRHDYACRAKG